LFIENTANQVNSGTGKGGVLAKKKAEAEARIKAIVEDKARAKAKVEARAVAEARTRARAEYGARTEAVARAWAEARARAEAEYEAKAKAEAEARIVAYEKAEAEVRAEPIFIAAAEFQALTTALHHLATDCLRLSMHFFHPIQQCAQQVYHTAIPLSPTSSHLQKCFLQNVVDNQLSLVTTFSGAPDTWGLLLRTIDIRPKQLTCITTSVQGIIAACGDLVNIYDPVTFVLHQSLSAPEAVTKIQVSPDGTILFLAHSLSVTMWDVQTGGLIHTFTVESEISDIAASTTGEHIACGCSDGSIAFWDIHTREGRGKHLGSGQPVVTVCWVSPLELAVAIDMDVYLHSIATNKVLNAYHQWGQVWGMVCVVNRIMNKEGLLVGISRSGPEVGQYQYSFQISKHTGGSLTLLGSQPLMNCGQLSQPMLVGEEVLCMIQPTGVQSFNFTIPPNHINNLPLLNAATSVAVTLNRNLVAQTKDSIQIFSLDVLTSRGTYNHNVTRVSRVYPLGKDYIICVQPTRSLTLLELETLRILHPKDDTSPSSSLFAYQSPSVRSPFDRGPVMEAWWSGTPLPGWIQPANEAELLSGLSPKCARIVTVYGSPRRGLRVRNAKDGIILASLPLDDDLAAGEVYDLTFTAETRFHLKIDGPGRHVQIPYDIAASPSGGYWYTITKGEPVPLPEPRKAPPYTLDENFEWVVDAKSRKICWIPPGNVRRGSGGHFWAGLSLVMVGDDGVARKLSFKEPDC